jgi:hypothetical protein
MIYQVQCFNSIVCYIIGAFLHLNYKALKSATLAEIDECHRTNRKMTVSAADELQQKKQDCFVESFMDHNTSEKKADSTQQKDEVDHFIELDLNSEVTVECRGTNFN